jgi:hypothetical protein
MQSVTTTCAPDEETLAKYEFRTAAFRFRGGEISDSNGIGTYRPITVRCNIVNPLDTGNPTWEKLVVGYQDPDGTRDNSRVEVRLKRVLRPSGGGTIAIFNSNAFSVDTNGERFISFSHEFDFQKEDYFFEINLYRKTISASPAIYRVRLE